MESVDDFLKDFLNGFLKTSTDYFLRKPKEAFLEEFLENSLTSIPMEIREEILKRSMNDV